jgi:8-oxo-dGDP phosphatase
VAGTGDDAGRWWTFGERVVYDDPSVWVGRVDVELPGGERHWHHVVHLHRATSVVLIDDQERVLLLWRYRFVADRSGWEPPGGLVDEDEEPAEAVMRELEEQAGYRTAQLDRLIAFQPVAGMVDAERVVFVGREAERVGEPISAADGIARREWVPFASVPGLIAAGEIWSAETLVGLRIVDR